jgi:phenylacetate-CoA ligase
MRGEWIGNHLKNLEKTQYALPEDIQNLQLQRLNKLLEHAKATVPYYANLPDLPFTSLKQLREIPLLEKDHLRHHSDQLFSSKTGPLTRYKTTGGSTGAAVTLRKDNIGMAHELAATWRGYRWAGIDVGDKQARFWGVPAIKKDYLRSKLIDWIAHRKRLSAFAFSEKELSQYFFQLKEFKPDYFYGYVSMIRQFADYLEREGRCRSLQPKAIITTAEALTETDRQKIEEVFGCRVFNEYGCGEVGTIAHECEDGNLHLSSENMVVEVLNESGNAVKPGEPGEIVVTDLVNFSMPLIRYRLKDYASVSGEDCSCGRSLPVLLDIHGREYDILVNSSGQKFHGEFFLYLVEDLKKKNVVLDHVQFIQQGMNINIKIAHRGDVKTEFFRDYFLEKLKLNFDPTVEVCVDFVSEITRESSGKLRTVIREC